MPIYEKRTYDIVVGQMPEVIRLYKEEGWPVLVAGGYAEHLVGYFTSDTGRLHQLVHMWRRLHEVCRPDSILHLCPRRATAESSAVGTTTLSHVQ